MQGQSSIQQQNESEVRRLMVQIELENHAARLALYGLSEGTSKHAFITSRMEQVAKIHDELVSRVGDDRAFQIVLEALQIHENEQTTTIAPKQGQPGQA